MPTMHRISCFRDDVIFVIYLYQRYTYRVDKTRGVYATERPDVKPEEVKSEGSGGTENQIKENKVAEEKTESKKDR